MSATEFIRLKKANCTNCYKCIRHCPVKAIRFSGGQAHIIQDACIYCGECFVICPQNAKWIYSETEAVKSILLQNEVYVSLAPSFISYFDTGISCMKDALKKLGFAGCEETAVGATIVKNVYEQLIQEEKKDVLILGIESSCDETAASVVKNGRTVLSNVISSQIEIHKLYGGVVPEIASRNHIERINQVIQEALDEANVTLDDIDAIGVTYGPGLVGALLVGVAEAKAIAYARNLPLVGVHHIEGHVSANYIEHPDLEPPFLCLIVSGGHTHLVIVKDYGEFEILGRTRDDAAGEAFDKVARAIGLGYPGGPKVDKLSKEGNPNAIEFPKAKIGDCPYDFSFSGVKSAVLNYINHAQMTGEEINRADLAASFQKAVVDVLVEHTMLAAKDYGMTKIAIAGGVASNGTLRAAMEEACKKNNYSFYRPSPIFCTDNAAMIGVAAYYEYIKGTRHGWDLNAVPNLKLGER